MENTIATKNSERLATLSVIFCAINGIVPTPELAQALAGAVMSNCAKWYDEHNLAFNPATELIEGEALESAFKRVQEIAILASISAQTGVGMEGFID